MAQQLIRDNVYMVTGATQGVGEACAMALAELNPAGIVLCGRNEDKGNRVRQAVEKCGVAAHFIAAELENPDDCKRLIDDCDSRFGRLDGLVNAAGLTERGTLLDTSAALWDRMFAVNARAPFLLMQGAAKIMIREGRGGAMVNIITMSSHGGQAKLTPYSASKGALVTLTKNAAHSLRYDRIRVNGLNIGWTDTPNEHQVQLAEGQDEDWLENAEKQQPFGQLIKTSEVGRAVKFLISPESGIMTGSIIDYDQMVIGGLD